MNFWNGVTLCLKVFAPLVKVLRLVDGDVKPSMGFLYGELKNAKEEIKVVLRNNVRRCGGATPDDPKRTVPCE
ncbi:hypothetical protein ACOSQ4_013643 [Xanthoceras sorbifolium]